jgi:hypothetical protein
MRSTLGVFVNTKGSAWASGGGRRVTAAPVYATATGFWISVPNFEHKQPVVPAVGTVIDNRGLHVAAEPPGIRLLLERHHPISHPRVGPSAAHSPSRQGVRPDCLGAPSLLILACRSCLPFGTLAASSP